jgi:hypothetical protein
VRRSSATVAYVTFQMADVAVSRQMFADILTLDRPAAGAARARMTNACQVHRVVRGRGMPRYKVRLTGLRYQAGEAAE